MPMLLTTYFAKSFLWGVVFETSSSYRNVDPCGLPKLFSWQYWCRWETCLNYWRTDIRSVLNERNEKNRLHAFRSARAGDTSLDRCTTEKLLTIRCFAQTFFLPIIRKQKSTPVSLRNFFFSLNINPPHDSCQIMVYRALWNIQASQHCRPLIFVNLLFWDKKRNFLFFVLRKRLLIAKTHKFMFEVWLCCNTLIFLLVCPTVTKHVVSQNSLQQTSSQETM